MNKIVQLVAPVHHLLLKELNKSDSHDLNYITRIYNHSSNVTIPYIDVIKIFVVTYKCRLSLLVNVNSLQSLSNCQNVFNKLLENENKWEYSQNL